MKHNYVITKGQAILDTNERQKEFMQKNSFGWEEKYWEYIRLWRELPENLTVSDYPIHIDIELSSICNLKCPMCFTNNENFIKNVTKKFIDFSLFKKIIDEVAGKIFKIHLSLRGESTLHPDFVKIISYAKNKGIYEVTTVTNGSKLDLDFFIECSNAGIDRFTISIDGLSSEYDNIRKPLKFDSILMKLKEIKNFKEKNNLIKPVIKVQGIWPSIKPNPTDYYNTFAPLVDLVSFNPLIDWLHNDKDIIYDDNFICSSLYQRLVISSDGKALLCINDENGEMIIGDANYESIHEIWNGASLNKVREIHKEGEFAKFEICRKCLLPRKVEVNEKAYVNGREILIENYINRKQIVGE